MTPATPFKAHANDRRRVSDQILDMHPYQNEPNGKLQSKFLEHSIVTADGGYFDLHEQKQHQHPHKVVLNWVDQIAMTLFQIDEDCDDCRLDYETEDLNLLARQDRHLWKFEELAAKLNSQHLTPAKDSTEAIESKISPMDNFDEIEDDIDDIPRTIQVDDMTTDDDCTASTTCSFEDCSHDWEYLNSDH